jgi:NAD(P)H-hydrate epimerase
LHPETGRFCGKVEILDIGLSKEFIENTPTDNFVLTDSCVFIMYKPRKEFSHKGNFGKTAIVAGSFGKIGAAVLATKSAMKTGSGITYALAPRCGFDILQISAPEAMFINCGSDCINEIAVQDDFVYGIGPGLGDSLETKKSFLAFLENYKHPLVLDADALNILSENSNNLRLIPRKSIITPHPKEFSRLFGETESSFERLELAKQKAHELDIYIVLKDHHTQIITPEQEVYYNVTGNPGLAKGGSGDVLLGVITSLLAQKYTPKEAAVFGVWLHGKAADFAIEKHSKESLLATDVIDYFGEVFTYLENKKGKL